MSIGWRAFTVAFVSLLIGAVNTLATDVVIVRTSDAEPYTQADTALQQQLLKADPKIHIKSLLAREASDKGIDASIGKPDVVVAIGTASAKWLHKQLPAEVKLMYCMVTNPSEATLMQGHPCMGVSTDVPIAEQLKLAGEALPNATRIGFLYRSDTSEGRNALAELQWSAPANWKVEGVAVNDYGGVADAIDTLMRKPIDVVWTTPDSKLYDTAFVRTLLLSAVRGKLPVWGYSLGFVRAGALIGVGVEPAAQGRQVADLIAKTLANPSDFKTRAISPEHFQIAVNKIVAEQIGVEIPDSVSQRAAYVYQPEK